VRRRSDRSILTLFCLCGEQGEKEADEGTGDPTHPGGGEEPSATAAAVGQKPHDTAKGSTNTHEKKNF
jgi:hypothetical protein